VGALDEARRRGWDQVDAGTALLSAGRVRLLRDEHRRSQHAACLTHIDSLKLGTSRITPLPHMPVLKDLVPDLTGLYAQYELIEPWLQSDQLPPDRERQQAP
jgi:hypothetical protein